MKVMISYWSAHELEEESEDHTTLDKVLADIVRQHQIPRVITYRASYYATSPSINLQTL